MFAVLLAALSSVSYGASDFSGAMASKRTDSAIVTVVAQFVSLVALAGVLLAVPPDAWIVRDLAWGAAGGVCVAVALVCFYRALAIGPMSTAAATTALVGALVPLVAGLAFGERPSVLTLVGIGVSIPAGALVSAGGAGNRASLRLTPRERWVAREFGAVTTRLSFVAGVGFGLFFVLLSRASDEAGLSPLLGARAASIGVLVLVLTAGGGWSRLHRSSIGYVAVAGVLDCAANVTYLAALDRGQLTWVAAIASLYPATTVALAGIVLRERLTRVQIGGLVLAGVALALVAIGR